MQPIGNGPPWSVHQFSKPSSGPAIHTQHHACRPIGQLNHPIRRKPQQWHRQILNDRPGVSHGRLLFGGGDNGHLSHHAPLAGGIDAGLRPSGRYFMHETTQQPLGGTDIVDVIKPQRRVRTEERHQIGEGPQKRPRRSHSRAIGRVGADRGEGRILDQPVQNSPSFVLDGRLETSYRVGASMMEPWRKDSTAGFEALQSTLQSIRRKAIVNVRPRGAAYEIEVIVQKDLEDTNRTQYATETTATRRHDGTVVRQIGGNTDAPVTLGWISLGRDTSLEQRILRDIFTRLTEKDGR